MCEGGGEWLLLSVDDTCGASLKTRPVGGHSAWVCGLVGLPHAHIEGASRNVATIELDIDGVDAVLPWNETDRVFVCKDNIRVSLDIRPGFN